MPEEYQPPLIETPLTVSVTEGEVVVNGDDLPGGLVMSHEAALKTRVALIDAGLNPETGS